MGYSYGSVHRDHNSKQTGRSVRCLKDSYKSLAISDVTVDEGQPVEVPIDVTDLTVTDNIISYQFDVSYDNTVLEYTGNTIIGTLVAGGTIDVNTSVAGKLSIGYINTTAILGAGTILNLQFNTLAADTTVLTISNAYLNTDSIGNLTNGRVIVKDITPPTVAITYNDTDVRYADQLTITATFSEPMLTSNAVKLSLSGAVTLTDESYGYWDFVWNPVTLIYDQIWLEYTDSSTDMTRQSATVYTYTYSVPKADGLVTIVLSNGTDMWSNLLVTTPTSGSTFTIVKMVYGDVDDNGKILAYDAALTLQHSVGLDPLPLVDSIPWENWRDSTANVDGVAEITANDAAMILQYSIGKITSFTAEGKKSTTASIADVTVEVVNNDIVFYSNGDLIGLNISTTNENQILGTPNILVDNFMSAFNISGTTYNLGLCTAYSLTDGVAIMKIPYNNSGSVTFNMIVNTKAKQVTIDLTTGVLMKSEKAISVYPNPANSILYFNGLEQNTNVIIYDLNGKAVIDKQVKNNQIDVSRLRKGMYSIKIEDKSGVVIRKFVMQ